jgi:hypothetical protein
MTFINCIFTNNMAKWDGAAITNLGNNMKVSNCNFTNNTANYGSAIYNHGQKMNISNCNFINNKGDFGGAIYNWGMKMNISSCNFTNNTVNWVGGAIYNGGKNISVSGCNFINSTSKWVGGAIYNWGTGIIEYNRFLNNTDETGFTIFNEWDIVLADFNWWGSNNNPSSLVSGFTINYWFVMMLSTNNSHETKVNKTVNGLSGNYFLNYQLVLYNSITQSFMSVSYGNLPDFLVNINWIDKNGNTIYSLKDVNAKGSYSFTVTLTKNNNFTIRVMGDSEDVKLIITGKSFVNDSRTNVDMKKTGIPHILSITLILLSIISTCVYRKQN